MDRVAIRGLSNYMVYGSVASPQRDLVAFEFWSTVFSQYHSNVLVEVETSTREFTGIICLGSGSSSKSMENRYGSILQPFLKV